MHVNFLIILAAALVPMAIGFIWYNPKVLGTAWMNAAEMTEEKMKNANMGLIFGLSFVFSFLFAMGLQFMVIHQFHIGSLFYGMDISDPNSENGAFYKAIMDKLGSNFRTFKHGALHGTIGGIMAALPIIGINALFERKSFKYIAINTGYWMLTMAIMGGIICAFS